MRFPPGLLLHAWSFVMDARRFRLARGQELYHRRVGHAVFGAFAITRRVEVYIVFVLCADDCTRELSLSSLAVKVLKNLGI